MVTWQDLSAKFEVSSVERAQRLERRLASVLRQLEIRIAEVDQLRHDLDGDLLSSSRGQQLQRRLVDLEREAGAWQGQYERVMATKTMRALRVPRSLYGRLRARLGYGNPP
jgi:hypothetical protein